MSGVLVVTREYQTVQLVIWNQGETFVDGLRPHPYSHLYKKIWCAVIRLEKRVTPFGTPIRGHIERCNVVVDCLHKSFNLLTCQSLSM
ncbi:unnamed protein product [Arabis nemorensis]|uniref:Uncharacterized protein n=1 Tax=Arabis nemorensis TaxID=586526 RepID=A0A565BEV3_9BRAS|nr:unnamed protein product [Arabis nemorensis]